MKVNIVVLIISFCTLFSIITYAQNVIQIPTSINESGTDPDNSAILDLNANEKGVLFPRMNSGQRTNIPSPAAGLLVYDTDQQAFYTFNGSEWEKIQSGLAIWDENGSDIYTNSANVGIGTDTPGSSLDVRGQTTTESLSITTGAINNYILQSNADGLASWQNSETALGWQRASSTQVYNTGDSVGINTNTPLEKLHIMGSTTKSSMILTPDEPFSGDDASIILTEDDDNTYNMEMKYDGGDNRLYFYGKNNASLNGPHLGINRDNGRVGIGTGTTNPSSELEVVGTVTANSYEGDGSLLSNIQADSLVGAMSADTNDILQWDGDKWAAIPYHRVAFHASASTDQTVGDTAYDTLRVNNSSSGENFEYPSGVFDNSSYAFIAPVDGIYFFEAAVLWDNANLSEARNAIFIRVNNIDEVGEWTVSGATDFFGTGVSTTLQLNEGDQIRVRVYNGDSQDMDTFSQSGKYCYFSGYLIFAE